jgi:enediyne biosynthesis protein E4
LWINQRNGTFRDTAPLAGVAVNGSGEVEASMGVDAGDYDNDGDEDLFITNWVSQMNTLYVNAGGGLFQDRKTESGLALPSVARTGFGTAWFDFDNDSWLDLLAVNGGVATIEGQARAKDPFPLKMPSDLYRNLGSGRFEDVSARGGAALAKLAVSRGAAFGDLDNDGDTDVVVGNTSGPMHLLINTVGSRNHWLGLRLLGRGRDMLGARVEIARPQRPALWRRVRVDGSYASANDPRVIVGLGGDAADAPRVRVHWPSGNVGEWVDAPIDVYVTLEEERD